MSGNKKNNKEDKFISQQLLEEEEPFLETKTTVLDSSYKPKIDLLNYDWNLEQPLNPEEFEPIPQDQYNNHQIVQLSSQQISPFLEGRFTIVAPKRIENPSVELFMVIYPESIASEQFRILKFKAQEESNIQVIGVTSPKEDESNPVVAANLALALSETGRVRVLLVDCNLRKPSLEKLFGIEGSFGLSTELKDKHMDPINYVPKVIGLAEALYLLPAGPPVANPTALLSSDIMAQFLYELRASFNYIVINIPPVLEYSDANAISDSIDTYILTARIKKTKLEDLEKATLRLNKEKVFGVVVIGAYPEK